VIEHKRFGTAKWQLAHPERPAKVARLLAGLDIAAAAGAALLPAHLDFVTARTEFYTEPTALPTVQQSSIKLDLHRRDFTINTLALALNPDRWGELLDFWGGLADLRGGWVRVLHSLSFVDDPTRILRAVRYEQRFGFRIEARTLELLGDALELLDRVTPARIRHELERILQEDAPEKALVRLDRLDILRQLDPDLRVTPALPRQFAALRGILAAPEADPALRAEPVERLYWAILVDPLEPEVHARLQRRLGLRGETQKLMRDVATLRSALPVLADPSASPSTIVLALDDVGPVALALAPLLYPDEVVQAHLAQYRAVWQAVRPELDGTDLRRLGVPRGAIYREILRELRARRLDETIHSRGEEEALVRQLTIDNRQ
jgi:tRNA nucleotidyltransferase (CCA-adding enzyme)